MRRIQKQGILSDLKKKMVFLVGPRQVGKTWLAKEIMKEYKNPLYLNYDLIEHRRIMSAGQWSENVDLIIFDELHKMPKWKNYLKGHFDTRNPNTHMLITGSARMEIFRKAGDSLAGRFFTHHLMPFSLKELQDTKYEGDLERLLKHGGFPEPFLSNDLNHINKWREDYVDTLLRADILDFTDIDKMRAMQDVFKIIKTKVSSPISYSNIAGDTGIAPATVKKYIEILEAMYIIFIVKPYSKKVGRSILKEPKIYFYDNGLVEGDESVKFENLVANALLKHVLGKRDFEGKRLSLHYIKNKEKIEVDFAIAQDDFGLEQIYEVKLSDNNLSPSLKYFSDRLNVQGIQIVKNVKQNSQPSSNIEIQTAKSFLKNLYL